MCVCVVKIVSIFYINMLHSHTRSIIIGDAMHLVIFLQSCANLHRLLSRFTCSYKRLQQHLFFFTSSCFPFPLDKIISTHLLFAMTHPYDSLPKVQGGTLCAQVVPSASLTLSIRNIHTFALFGWFGWDTSPTIGST